MDKKSARATVALTPEELESIKILSRAEQRTVSQIIRNIVRAQLNGCQLLPGIPGVRGNKEAA